MATKNIKQLTPVASVTGAVKLEVDDGTASDLSADMDDVGVFAGTVKTYPGLTTTSKTIEGAINELDAGLFNTFKDLSDVSGAYTTASALYRVNGTVDGLVETTIIVGEPAANQFEFASGTTKLAMSANLSVTGATTLNQSVDTTASPTFVQASASAAAPTLAAHLARKDYVDGHFVNGIWTRTTSPNEIAPTNDGDTLNMKTGLIEFRPGAGSPSWVAFTAAGTNNDLWLYGKDLSDNFKLDRWNGATWDTLIEVDSTTTDKVLFASNSAINIGDGTALVTRPLTMGTTAFTEPGNAIRWERTGKAVLILDNCNLDLDQDVINVVTLDDLSDGGAEAIVRRDQIINYVAAHTANGMWTRTGTIIDTAVANDQVAVNTSTVSYTVNATTAKGALALGAPDSLTDNNVILTRYSDTALISPDVLTLTARGTEGSPTVTVTGDRLFSIRACGHDGTDFEQAAQINIGAEGTIAAGQIPGNIEFVTANSVGSLTKAMTIDSAQKVTLTAGTGINEFSIDGTLGGDSDDAVPTEKAVRTYVDNAVAGENLWDRVTGATNYLIPNTAADEIGGSAAPIVKGWFTNVQSGNINVAGQNIQSTIGDLNLTAKAGSDINLTVNGNTNTFLYQKYNTAGGFQTVHEVYSNNLGTPAIGDGSATEYQIRYQSSNEFGTKVGAISTDITNGAEYADYVVQTMSSGSALEAFRYDTKNKQFKLTQSAAKYIGNEIDRATAGTLTIGGTNASTITLGDGIGGKNIQLDNTFLNGSTGALDHGSTDGPVNLFRTNAGTVNAGRTGKTFNFFGAVTVAENFSVNGTSYVEVVNLAGTSPVASDVSAWSNNTGGFGVGTGNELFWIFKHSSGIGSVSLTA